MGVCASDENHHFANGDLDFEAWAEEQRELGGTSPKEARAFAIRQSAEERSQQFNEADAKYKELEVALALAKAERDRLGESARMHLQAAEAAKEKAQAVLPKMPEGGLGRVIEQVQRNDPRQTALELFRAHKVGAPLDGGTCKALCNALLLNTHVTSLDIHCNDIGDEGAAAISYLMKKNPFIGHINVASCAISDSGAFHIGEAMKTNRTVTYLNIGNWGQHPEDVPLRNTIGDRGARQMAAMIRENKGLRKLLMNNLSRISDDGAHQLMLAVRSGLNRTLTDLYLENAFGISEDKRDDLRKGNKSVMSEEGSLLTASTEEEAKDARLLE